LRGGGGGGGGIGHIVPAGTLDPSGQVVIGGGGGGGGGHGVVTGIDVPSGQVCISGGGGVVAHAASTIVPAKISISLISLSSFLTLCRLANENAAGRFQSSARALRRQFEERPEQREESAPADPQHRADRPCGKSVHGFVTLSKV
jgi:hypothetical protein